MRKHSSLRVIMLLAFVSVNMNADYMCEGPLEKGSWFVTPKIGLAPSIFASRKARQQFVVPRAAWNEEICNAEEPSCNVDNFANTLQEGPCLPKFSDMFHQGVLHVGVELGYNICDNSPWFIEFVYNRASGRCVGSCDEFVTAKATTGCSTDCNDGCSTTDCSDTCCPTGESLSNICGIRDDYDNYSAYGGYLGARYFSDRFWCDTTSVWFGYKVGILHRKRIDACSTFLFPQDAPQEDQTPAQVCEAGTQEVLINRAIFCKSNSVSGGIQAGFDYCYNECLSFQFGFEVVASCGLRGNRNHPINIADIKDSEGQSFIDNANFPSNVLIRNTGAVVNFPIWFGMKWNFGDFCNPCEC